MADTIAISDLSLSQKLKLMEDLWADLSREPEKIPAPKWHLDVLAEREKLVREGKAKFVPWPEAKHRLRRKRE
jgi:hypothetical protein